jgi:hypothetical protein
MIASPLLQLRKHQQRTVVGNVVRYLTKLDAKGVPIAITSDRLKRIDNPEMWLVSFAAARTLLDQKRGKFAILYGRK